MFKPLHSLFKPTKNGKVVWSERDQRYAIEQYLRAQLKTETLYCEKAVRGGVVVRVATPADAAEVYLLEYDLKRWLEQETGIKLKQLRVLIA